MFLISGLYCILCLSCCCICSRTTTSIPPSSCLWKRPSLCWHSPCIRIRIWSTGWVQWSKLWSKWETRRILYLRTIPCTSSWWSHPNRNISHSWCLLWKRCWSCVRRTCYIWTRPKTCSQASTSCSNLQTCSISWINWSFLIKTIYCHIYLFGINYYIF